MFYLWHQIRIYLFTVKFCINHQKVTVSDTYFAGHMLPPVTHSMNAIDFVVERIKSITNKYNKSL